MSLPSVAQGTATVIPNDFATRLLGEPELGARARIIAERVTDTQPGSAAAVYVCTNGLWMLKASAGAIPLHRAEGLRDAASLNRLLQSNRAVLLEGSELSREVYAHLDVRRTVLSLACIPLNVGNTVIGAVEWVAFEQPITAEDIAALTPAIELASVAVAAAIGSERERNSNLQSISRLAQLYDLEKVFHSTLDLDAVQPVITAKLQEVLEVRAVNLWLVAEGDELKLVHQSGDASEAQVGDVAGPEDAVARVAESGAGTVFETGVHRAMAAPLISDESLVGVLEVVGKKNGLPFDDDDLFFLTSLCDAAAGALANASRFYAERKAEILETLVDVSKEITGTLNLDRVLQAIVNGPSAVIPYERATIALERGGKLEIGAISGEQQFNPGDEAVKRLSAVLQWAAGLDQELYVREIDGDISDSRDETRAKFRRYFEDSGMRAFFCLPLRDDEGRVGVLSLESTDPDFLNSARREMTRVLAGQATVALRNAQLYRDVPFINVLEPVIQKKQQFLALPRRRRNTLIGVAVAAVLFLAVFPVPMRVSGFAGVAPVRRAVVGPEMDGTVRKVFVREGQLVHRGDILADLEDWDYRSALAGAQAKYEAAVSEMNRALANNDGTEAGVHRVDADFWNAEVQRARERLDHTHLRAPIDGFVTTAHIENFGGRRLSAGETFAEIEDSSHATVDIAVDEQAVPLLRTNARAAIKLDGFPLKTFRGNVAIISPKATSNGQERLFYARVDVPNANSIMRSGMQGRGKISVGWRPVGYVLFRRPGLWIYRTVWSWLGW